MKKIVAYLLLFFAFVSCEDNVKFNNPTFEGQKDNVFWRAIDAKVMLLSDGGLMVEGYTRNEIISLKTASITAQTYTLGIDDSNKVTYTYKDANGTITYETGDGIGEGEIVIEEYDAVNKTVSGTFKFNAENIYNNPLAGPLLNFQYGRFYKVPVVSSLISYLPGSI